MRALHAVMLVGMTGCTLLVSTSGYDNGSGAASNPDAASDAGADAPAAIVEAGADADAKADAPFCASLTPSPTFCADFVVTPLDPTDWDDIVDSGGTLTVEDGQLVSTTAPAGELFRPAFLRKSTEEVTVSYRIAADIFVERAEVVPTSRVVGARILGFRASANVFVGLQESDQLVVVENWGTDGAMKSLHGLGSYPRETWFHVEMTLDVPKKLATVTVDGKTISDGTALAGPFDPKPIAGFVGVYYAPVEAGGFRVRYDNVVIDAR